VFYFLLVSVFFTGVYLFCNSGGVGETDLSNYNL
jgi:hypothetical protein